MANSTDTTRTPPPLDGAAFEYACGEAIRLARKMKQRIAQDEPGIGREFSEQIMPLFKQAGATLDEALHYSARCIMMVLAEPQA